MPKTEMPLFGCIESSRDIKTWRVEEGHARRIDRSGSTFEIVSPFSITLLMTASDYRPGGTANPGSSMHIFIAADIRPISDPSQDKRARS